MKKFLALLFVLVLVLSVTGCAGSYTTTDGTHGKAKSGQIMEDKTVSLTITRIDPVGGRHSYNTQIDYVFVAKNDDIVVVFRGDSSDYALLEVGDVIECRYTIESSVDYTNGEQNFYYLGESRVLEYLGANEER